MNNKYRELDKNYMSLLRPLQVTDDDTSTIYNRLTSLRVSIETIVQRAKNECSANMNREVAIQYFRHFGLLNAFPIEDALLDSYHLNLCMESSIMNILVGHLFGRPLECVLDQDRSWAFVHIHDWVYNLDRKVATRWRQQLCHLIVQDTAALECKRDKKVNETIVELSHLFHLVYPTVDMTSSIKTLCYTTFDLSFAMLGLESMIYMAPVLCGIPFDDKTMTTPQKSNPEGSVSLVIFPAFQDNDGIFLFKPKVWCF